METAQGAQEHWASRHSAGGQSVRASCGQAWAAERAARGQPGRGNPLRWRFMRTFCAENESLSRTAPLAKHAPPFTPVSHPAGGALCCAAAVWLRQRPQQWRCKLHS